MEEMDEADLQKLKLQNYRKWYYIKNREKIAEYQRRYYLRKKGLKPYPPSKWRGEKIAGGYKVKKGNFVLHFN